MNKISLMVSEELLRQVIHGSMMDNLKMELCMDTLKKFTKLDIVISSNIMMGIK